MISKKTLKSKYSYFENHESYNNQFLYKKGTIF